MSLTGAGPRMGSALAGERAQPGVDELGGTLHIGGHGLVDLCGRAGAVQAAGQDPTGPFAVTPRPNPTSSHLPAANPRKV
jgi:hypothetical protein